MILWRRPARRARDSNGDEFLLPLPLAATGKRTQISNSEAAALSLQTVECGQLPELRPNTCHRGCHVRSAGRCFSYWCAGPRAPARQMDVRLLLCHVRRATGIGQPAKPAPQPHLPCLLGIISAIAAPHLLRRGLTDPLHAPTHFLQPGPSPRVPALSPLQDCSPWGLTVGTDGWGVRFRCIIGIGPPEEGPTAPHPQPPRPSVRNAT